MMRRKICPIGYRFPSLKPTSLQLVSRQTGQVVLGELSDFARLIRTWTCISDCRGLFLCQASSLSTTDERQRNARQKHREIDFCPPLGILPTVLHTPPSPGNPRPI